jgi:hypothetical protein
MLSPQIGRAGISDAGLRGNSNSEKRSKFASNHAKGLSAYAAGAFERATSRVYDPDLIHEHKATHKPDRRQRNLEWPMPVRAGDGADD